MAKAKLKGWPSQSQVGNCGDWIQPSACIIRSHAQRSTDETYHLTLHIARRFIFLDRGTHSFHFLVQLNNLRPFSQKGVRPVKPSALNASGGALPLASLRAQRSKSTA